MPWTFAHPAAALPLRRLCPKFLSFPALAVGCLTPDLGYYVGQFRLATFAHSFTGSFLVCLPSGLLVLAILLAIRKPVCHLLPHPHREAVARLTEPRPLSPLRIGILALSVVLGSWTHIVWDAFTHAGRWGATHVAFIREPLFQLGAIPVRGYMLLQHLSTIVGTALLVGAYVAWLRRNRAELAPRDATDDEERRRWWLIGAAVAATAAITVPLALFSATHEDGHMAFSTFVFSAAIHSAVIFSLVFTAIALFHYSGRPANTER